jgi:hypothetical protein
MFQLGLFLVVFLGVGIVGSILEAILGWPKGSGSELGFIVAVVVVGYLLLDSAMVERDSKRRDEEEARRKEAERREREDQYREMRRREGDLLVRLQEAETFDDATCIYDIADNGSEVKNLAWHKMRKLI